MWNTRRKRLKEAIEKRKAKKEHLDDPEDSEDEEPEDVEDADLEPLPKVFPGIPQLKLEEIHKMASKYSDTNVRLSIKARDAERITRELIDLRDEVLRLRLCIPATANSFEDKSLVDSSFSLEVPSDMDIEIHDLEDL